jgi:hypothetical protein
MDTEDKINKLAELIRKIVDKDNKMQGQYSMPYSTSEDDYADWKVTFKVIRVSLWESKKYNQCKYGASVYLKADVIVGFNGDWDDKFNIWDLPSWVKDDVEDKILNNIDQFLPMVCVDLTFV